MRDLYVHSETEHHISRIVAHTEDGARIDSSQMYPPVVKERPLREGSPLDMNEYIMWQRDLHMSSRGRETLIVEPEGAQWVILNELFFSIFEMMKTPVPLHSVLNNPFASERETYDFLTFLLSKNIIRRRDWPTLFPPVMPSVFHYPSFFSIHVTESCNFGCRYCYADAPSAGKKMSEETLLTIIEKIFRDFARQDFTIEFHGGEPLLVKDTVRKACQRIRELQEKIKPRRCKILLQTNGSLLQPSDMEFFREFDISVGISMDGPPEIHDRNRVFRDGRGTHEATLRGIKMLREHNINGGILAVVENPEEYIPICDYIFSTGTTGFRLNHMVCQGRGEVDLSLARERGEQFARELLELLDYMDSCSKAYPDMFIDVWPINIMLFHLVSTHRPFMCMRSPCGAGSHGLGFDYKGDVYPCEQLAGFEELRVGNVNDSDSLFTLLEKSPVIEKIRLRRVENIAKCSKCPFRNFCGGGCTAEAFSVFRNLEREDIYCTFYRRTFENLMWELNRRGDLSRLMGAFGR